MNPTTIDWCTIRDDDGEIIKRGFTWNPIVGCTNGCDYCYARRIAETRLGSMCDQFPEPWMVDIHGLDPEVSLCGQFFPHLHENRLDDVKPRTTPRGVFIGSMGDMWDPEVPQKWRDVVCDEIYCANPAQQPEGYRFDCARNTYWALTKQPQNITGLDVEWIEMIDNLWLGVSVTGREDAWRIYDLIDRVPEQRFVSFEPLQGLIVLDPAILELLDWVIIGAMTGPGAIAPEREWVFEMAEQCREAGVPVYVKNNLRPLMGIGGIETRQQHPAAMGETA